jgi:hypothetical protein
LYRNNEKILASMAGYLINSSTDESSSGFALFPRGPFECLFAWSDTFNRLIVRDERHTPNYLGFVQFGCNLIPLGRYM